MPIINPMTYNCKKCGWSAVKMEGDVRFTAPGSSKCLSCGGGLDEKLGSVFDLLNPVKRIRGLRLNFQEQNKIFNNEPSKEKNKSGKISSVEVPCVTDEDGVDFIHNTGPDDDDRMDEQLEEKYLDAESMLAGRPGRTENRQTTNNFLTCNSCGCSNASVKVHPLENSSYRYHNLCDDCR